MKADDQAPYRRNISDILRVDHAGEYGAIRIYQAQRLWARWRSPDLLAFLDRTLVDERMHGQIFMRLMRERDIGQCRALSIWGLGGSFLGLFTGAFGPAGILICTEAVERTVHKHLEDQVRWLAGRDAVLATAIAEIQAQELEHLEYAVTHLRTHRTPMMAAMYHFVVWATEILIWLSTYGASARLAIHLAASDRRR